MIIWTLQRPLSSYLFGDEEKNGNPLEYGVEVVDLAVTLPFDINIPVANVVREVPIAPKLTTKSGKLKTAVSPLVELKPVDDVILVPEDENKFMETLTETVADPFK